MLLFVLAGLPFAAFVFSKATHSGMTSRYVLATVLGIVLGLGYYGAKADNRAILVAGMFVVSATGVSELHFWRFEAVERGAVRVRGSTTERFVASAGYADLPVVAPNAGTLLAAAYYAFPGATERLVFLQEPRSPDDPNSSDTTEKGLLQVRKYIPIQVLPTEEFLAKHERFLVYTEGLDVGKDRVTSQELKNGWDVRMVAFDGYRALYLVSRNVK